MAPQGISRDKAHVVETASWLEQLRRGGLELAILLAIAPGARYGLEIIRHLDTFTSLVVTEGTIYPILARLTRDGFLQAAWNAADSAHPRKYYQLTPDGRARLRQMVGEWQTFSAKIDRLVAAAGKGIGYDID
jgi:PadR family transcriptional regulator PadR